MADSPRPRCGSSLEDVLAVLQAGSAGVEETPARTDAPSKPSMTDLDHHLQCAAILRDRYPEDQELQVAGLLHDIGHRLSPGRPDLHGTVGGEYLRDLFGTRVGDLVELHVDAKRYLVHTEADYRARLSAGSARTLIAQGEEMDDAEAAEFIARPHATDALALRRADEEAKVPGRRVPGLDEWMPVLEAVAAAR